MNNFSNKLTILDEIIDFLSEKHNIPIDETHNSFIQEIFNDQTLYEDNLEEESAAEEEAAKADGPEDIKLPPEVQKTAAIAAKELESGEMEPHPQADKMADNASSAFEQSLKKHGLVGTAAKPVLGVVEKSLKFLFGSGVFDAPQDATPLIKHINRNPYLAPYFLSAHMSLLDDATEGSMLSKKAEILAKFADEAGDSLKPGAVDGVDGVEGDEAGAANFAVPVFKKFSGKDQEGGAPPRSLASQLAKLFPEVPKSAVSQILKDLAKQMKAQDIDIQENREIIANILREMLTEKKPSKRQRAIARQKLAKAATRNNRQRKGSSGTAKQGKAMVAKLKAGAITGQKSSGERKEFHQLSYGNSIKKAKEAAEAWARSEEQPKPERSVKGQETGPGDTGLHKGDTRNTGRTTKGKVNSRQSVGPSLKAVGIDLKSPEGKKIHKKMLKVIRRFLAKNLQRLGKEDIKVISEKVVKELQSRGIINES